MSQSAHIHSVHEHICNLVNERGELLTITTESIGRNPFSIILPTNKLPRWDGATPVRIQPENQTIVIGEITIQTQIAEIWSARPDWAKLRSLNVNELPDGTLFSAEYQPHLKAVIQAVKDNDPAAIYAPTYWLAGRGNGATPAGDDFLMGVLYALWVWRPESDLKHTIHQATFGRTTTLSANYLSAAKVGEAIERWHTFVNAPSDQTLLSLYEVGHSSGRDAWTGFKQTALAIGPTT